MPTVLVASYRAPRAGWLLAVELAVRDALYEWRLSIFAAAGLAAVLAPLLVLLGLKVGLIQTLTERLVSDPSIRGVRVIGQGQFGVEFFAQARQRPDVGFIVPSTRYLAASAYVGPYGKNTLEAELLPSGEGDPLLPGQEAPQGTSSVAISADLAHRLGIKKGGPVPLRVSRGTPDGKIEDLRLIPVATAVVPSQLLPRDSILVSLELLEALEDWRVGFAVPTLEQPGAPRPAVARSYASFRLYARDIDVVAGLRDWLLTLGLNVRTRQADIDMVHDIDRVLTVVFAILAVIATTGQAIALVLGHAATVARKRREIAAMRLLGLGAVPVAIFPMAQAAVTALAGGVLAVGAFMFVAYLINENLNRLMADAESPCVLPAATLVAAVAATTALSTLASGWSVMRALRINASEGLREE